MIIYNKYQFLIFVFYFSEFPNVIGSVDCTHVKIQGPTNNEQDYVNRKGYHSINVQVVIY